MINKNFKKDWSSYDCGEINFIDSEHFSLDIDKDFFSLSISLSYKIRMIYICIGHLVFRIY